MSPQSIGLAFVTVLIILPVVAAIILVLVDHRRKVQQLEHLHRERIAAIEKGLLPPSEPIPDERPSAYLFRGLLFLALGAVFLFGPFGKLGLGVELTGWIMWAGAAASLAFFGWQTTWGRRFLAKRGPSQTGGA